MTSWLPNTPTAEVLRLATAYQASRALHVAVRCGIPDLLAGGPKSVEHLAVATGAHVPSLHRLMRALTAFDVFAEASDGCFGLGPLGGCLLAGATGSVRDLVAMWGDEDFWQTWGELEHSVRTGETAAWHLYGAEDAFARYAADERLGPVFNAGMTTMSAAVAAIVVSTYDFASKVRVVDVGGGQGRLMAEILRANVKAHGVLLDLPTVVAGAQSLLAESGVADRCEVTGGDIFAAVPTGGDLYVLKSVVHDWSDDRAIAILANCRRAMAEGARLLLVERVLPERIEPTNEVRSLVLSDLNMLVRNGGRERTERELRELLGAAGLQLERIVPTGTPFSLVEAVPASVFAVQSGGEAPSADYRRGEVARQKVLLPEVGIKPDG